MSINVTNQKASQALNGQDAIVTFSQTNYYTIATLAIGGKAGVVSSGKFGTISEVDIPGYTVKVKPASPAARFDSSATPGILNVNEVVTFF
jgi:hypothetical protein